MLSYASRVVFFVKALRKCELTILRDHLNSRRSQKRLAMALPVEVTCFDADGLERTERSVSQDISTHGARFTLSRRVESGQLLRLKIPMPPQLRRYDYDQAQYEIWAMARFVRGYRIISAGGASPQQFEIGVAFIGKNAPAGFHEDPAIRYQLEPPPTPGDFWVAREIAPETEATVEERLEEAPAAPLAVTIEIYDSNGEIVAGEETFTSRLSERNAVVLTTLPAVAGSLVRLTCDERDLQFIAIVSERREADQGILQLRLDFIEKKHLACKE